QIVAAVPRSAQWPAGRPDRPPPSRHRIGPRCAVRTPASASTASSIVLSGDSFRSFRCFFVFRDHFNQADDVPIHLSQVLGRDPQLLVDGATHCLNWIAGNEFIPHCEPGDVTGTAGRNVPIPSDLPGILLV